MEGDNNRRPIKEPLFSRLVGTANEAIVQFCDATSSALIDSGSMVTTVSEELYRSLDPRPVLRSLDDFGLTVHGPNGAELPYMGYIEACIGVDFLDEPVAVPVLVVPTTEYGLTVPLVIGTNVIRLCK